MKDSKVAIIGAGQVGSTFAYSLYNSDICDVILLNHNKQKAISNVIDIQDSLEYRTHTIRYATYEDIDDVDIIINCAGNSELLRTRDRYSEFDNSKRIAYDILSNINKTSFKGIFINVMNPCDDITYIFKDLNIPNNQIIGTGTSLETIRLRNIVKQQLNLITESFIIGRHGDFNSIVCKDVLKTMDEDKIDNLLNFTQKRVWSIYEGKGYTNFGITNILLKLVASIINNSNYLIPVSTLCGFNYGISNQCVSLPCRIGSNGIDEVDIDEDVLKTLDRLYGGK